MRHYNPGHIPAKEAEQHTPAPEKHFHTTEQHHHHYLKVTKNRREKLVTLLVWVWRVILLALILWLALGRAHAQQTPLNFDASGNLNVNVAAGGGAGGTSSTFGAAFPGTGTAAGFKDGGGLLQPGLLDASNFLKVDCAAGCSGAADNSASGTLNAGSGAGNTLAIALAGDNSASFTLPSGNTLVATIVAEYSSDNQTTWQATSVRAPAGQWVANVAVSSTQNSYNIQVPGGASHVRVRLSAFTSGTAAAVMRAVGQPELVTGASAVAGTAIPAYLLMIGGSDGTNARALSVSAAGAAKVDGSAVTQPVSAASLPLPSGAAADASVTGLEVAQASTTSGQKGALIQCAVTTNAPTYTTAQTDPCSLDVSGLLRVSLKDTPSNTNAFNVQGTLADNGAAAATNRIATLPAIAESNMPSAATAGRNTALRTDLQGNLLASLVPNGLTTFAANKQGLAPASSATDIAVLPGNATNTVVVTKVITSCTQTTAGIVDIQLIKRSTADTAGTSAAITAVPLDSGNAAAVSAPLSYTVNPTTGTAVGNVDAQKIGVMAPGTASPNDIYVWKPGYGQAVVLRGTAQQLAVNLNAVTLTGGSCDITFEWIETTGL